jgi:hypothetical protein
MQLTPETRKKLSYIRLQEFINIQCCGPEQFKRAYDRLIAFEMNDSHKLQAQLIENVFCLIQLLYHVALDEKLFYTTII